MKLNKRRKIVLIVICSIVSIILLSLFIYYQYNNSTAALSIESVPESFVYIDGEQKGKTPIELELRKDNIELRLVPDSFSNEISEYKTDVNLTTGVRTIVRHVFSNTDSYSQSEIISFEKVNTEASSLAVVTIPDGVKVEVDNEERGVSPIRVDKLLNGRHSIQVSAPGYRTRNFDVQTLKGYLLTAFVDLAEDENFYKEQQKTKAVLSEQIKQEAASISTSLTILDTPTGFLRVRDKPGIGGEEVARAIPGEKYDVKSFNAEEGWFEIILQASSSATPQETGWISSKYASASAELRPQN